MNGRQRLLLPLESVRWRLGILWFAGAGLLVAVLAVQSLEDVYEKKVANVWGWLLPNIIPTLSLMLGVFAASAIAHRGNEPRLMVKRPFYRLATALSIAHLLCLAAVLVSYQLQFSTSDGEGPVDSMRVFQVSNFWLGPLQGIVTAALSALFFSNEEEKTEEKSQAATASSEPRPPEPG